MKLVAGIGLFIITFIIKLLVPISQFSFVTASTPLIVDFGLRLVISFIISFIVTAILFITTARILWARRKFHYRGNFLDLIRSPDWYPSLGIFQFAVWAFIFTFLYVGVSLVMVFGGVTEYQPISSTMLALIGISISVAIISSFINRRKYEEKEYSLSYSEPIPGFLTILQEKGKVTIARLQMFLWTLISAMTYMAIVFSNLSSGNSANISFPDTSSFVLTIITITTLSDGIYLVSKILSKTELASATAKMVESGIESESVESGTSTEISRKIEKQFTAALDTKIIAKRMTQSKEFKDFVLWCRIKVKEDPTWFLSIISDEFVKEILEMVKSRYSTFLLKEINSNFRNLLTDQIKQSQFEIHRAFDLIVKIKPFEFYVELERSADRMNQRKIYTDRIKFPLQVSPSRNADSKEISLSNKPMSRSSTARITFKVDTDVRVNSITVHSTSVGPKINVEDLLVNLRLVISKIAVSRLSVNYLYKPSDFEIVTLEEKEFRLKDLFLYDDNTDTRVWITEKGTVHRAIDALELGKDVPVSSRDKQKKCQ